MLDLVFRYNTSIPGYSSLYQLSFSILHMYLLKIPLGELRTHVDLRRASYPHLLDDEGYF